MKELLNKLSSKLNLQIIIFLFLLPFIDTYEELIGGKIQIFGIALVELVKILLINYLLFLAIYKYKDKILKLLKKHKIAFLLFFILFLAFIILHLYNVANLKTNLINGMSKNIFVEFYYMYRTYCLCLLFFITVFLSDLKKDELIKYVSIICLLIGISIVLSNFLGIGHIAYDSDLIKSTKIYGTIFNWFNELNINNANYYTTKAWFCSTNQLSLVIISILMMLTLNIIKSKNKILLLLYPFVLIAALMISTKTCLFAIFISLAIIMIVNPTYQLIKKEKLNIFLIFYSFVLLLGTVFLFRYSPINYKLNILTVNQANDNIVAENITIDKSEIDQLNDDEEEENNADNDITIKEGASLADLILKDNLSNKEKKILISLFNQNYSKLGINEVFVNLYPIKDNINFWKKVILLPQYQRLDYRNFKILMYNDVIEKNNNKIMDTLFGVGYVSKLEYIEKDFIGQVALYGIVGTICLIGPYLLIFLIGILKFFKNFQRNFNIDNIVLGMAIVECLAASYIAGHLFGNIFPMAFFITLLKCFYEGVNYQNNKTKHNK